MRCNFLAYASKTGSRTLERLMSLQHRYETYSNIYHHLANNLISYLIYALKYKSQTRAPKKI